MNPFHALHLGAHVVKKLVEATKFTCAACHQDKHGIHYTYSCCGKDQCSSCSAQTSSRKQCSVCGCKAK